MNKALIILTDFYPYRSGETFIDTERDQWDRFDQVYIIPVMAENTDIIRPGFRIKKNETIIRVRNDYTKFSKMISVFTGERGFRCVLKEMRYLYDNHLLRTSTVKEMLSQHALAGLRYRSIRKSIKEIPGDCRILIYSYWLYEPALVAVNIRSQLKEARLISRAKAKQRTISITAIVLPMP